MRKFCSLVLVALIHINFLVTETAAENLPVDEPVISEIVGRPALWKVNDEDTTIFIFGTVHILPSEVQWSTEVLSTSIGLSETLVTEIDLAEDFEAEIAKFLSEKAFLSEETSLRDLLDLDQREDYEAALSRLSIPANIFDNFKPWYAGMVLTTLPLQRAGYSQSEGVEQAILRNTEHITTEGLETISYQLSIFAELPLEKQIQMLMANVASLDDLLIYTAQMIEAWLIGDQASLAELITAGLSDPYLAEKILYDRNKNWALWIAERLERPGTTFMAIGAGHLTGERGLEYYLTDHGINMVRIQ